MEWEVGAKVKMVVCVKVQVCEGLEGGALSFTLSVFLAWVGV